MRTAEPVVNRTRDLDKRVVLLLLLLRLHEQEKTRLAFDNPVFSRLARMQHVYACVRFPFSPCASSAMRLRCGRTLTPFRPLAMSASRFLSPVSAASIECVSIRIPPSPNTHSLTLLLSFAQRPIDRPEIVRERGFRKTQRSGSGQRRRVAASSTLSPSPPSSVDCSSCR